MTHYQKIAVVIFRITGIFFLVFAALIIVLAFVGFLLWLYDKKNYDNWFNLLVSYALPTSVIAVVFFLLSKKFAEWICFDFKESDEQK